MCHNCLTESGEEIRDDLQYWGPPAVRPSGTYSGV